MKCKHGTEYRRQVSSEVLAFLQDYMSTRGSTKYVYVLGQQLGVPSRAYQICTRCGKAKAVGSDLKPTIRVVTLPNALSALQENGKLTAKLQEALELLEDKITHDSGEDRTSLTTIKAFLVPALRGAQALEGKHAAA